MRMKLVVLLALLVCAFACARKPNVDAARSVSGQIGSALASKDIEKLKASLTDDAVLVRDKGPALVGRDAIVANYSAAFKQVAYDVTFLSEATDPVGDVVIDRGKVEGTLKTTGGNSSPVSGEYFNVLKPQGDGGWRVWRGVWTLTPGPIKESTCTSGQCCCTGVQIGDECVKPPAVGGCPGTHPILVNK